MRPRRRASSTRSSWTPSAFHEDFSPSTKRHSSGSISGWLDDVPVSTVHVPIYLEPADLAGFYTGYAVNLDGEKEVVTMTVDPPAVFYAQNEARFTYALNTTRHQEGGAGIYNMNTGHILLNDSYLLYAAQTAEGDVLLTSVKDDVRRPEMEVKKNREDGDE